MPTSTSSGLLRLLLSLITRFRLSARCIAIALRAVAVSSWRWILAFARPRRYSRIQLSASNAPLLVDTNPTGEQGYQAPSAEVDKDQDCSGGPTKSPPAQITWQSRLSILQTLTSNYDPRPFSFCCATPEGASQRYDLDKSKTDNLLQDAQDNIPAGQHPLLFSLAPLPLEWRCYIHPEGVRLFYHEKLRIFTEHDISKPAKEKEILFYVTKLVEKASQIDGAALDELTEIVLNVDNNGKCQYYFVDHTHRLLFWVHEVKLKDFNIHPRKNSGYNHISMSLGNSSIWLNRSTGVHPPLVLQHILYLHNLQLRSHCEYYPHTCPLSQVVVKDLKGTLNYAKIDMITTDSSSSPFGQDELVAMLDLLDSIKDDSGISDTYSTWAIARLMAYFTENQFLNFCGQTCARLNADTTLFEKPKWHRHFLFQVINLFLLGSPDEHAVRLQRVWVDGTIIQPRWKDFVNRLTSELGRYTIFSTVMLAVSFSFLAVPGVITLGSTAGPIQVIIYCSIVSTIASIVFSFGLLNVYSNPRLLIARNVTQAFGTLGRTKTGMASLAISHSLPIASLIWSIALFSTALAVQIFSPKEPATVAALSFEVLVIVLCVVMGVRVMRHFSQDDGFDGDTSTDAKVPLSAYQRPSRNDDIMMDDVEGAYHEDHAVNS